MDPAFWIGLFGSITAVTTAIATHYKNTKQDESAHKRDLRIAVLEVEHRVCNEERLRLLDRLDRMDDAKQRPPEAKE